MSEQVGTPCTGFTIRHEEDDIGRLSQTLTIQCDGIFFTQEQLDKLVGGAEARGGDYAHRDAEIALGFITNQIKHNYDNGHILQPHQYGLLTDSLKTLSAYLDTDTIRRESYNEGVEAAARRTDHQAQGRGSYYASKIRALKKG